MASWQKDWTDILNDPDFQEYSDREKQITARNFLNRIIRPAGGKGTDPAVKSFIQSNIIELNKPVEANPVKAGIQEFGHQVLDESITGEAAKALHLRPQYDIIPSPRVVGTGGEIAKGMGTVGGMLADPAAIGLDLLAGGAGHAAKATKLAKATPWLEKMLKMGVPQGIASGASQGAAYAGLQSYNDGQFDPKAAAMQAAIGGAFGGILSRITGGARLAKEAENVHLPSVVRNPEWNGPGLKGGKIDPAWRAREAAQPADFPSFPQKDNPLSQYATPPKWDAARFHNPTSHPLAQPELSLEQQVGPDKAIRLQAIFETLGAKPDEMQQAVQMTQQGHSAQAVFDWLKAARAVNPVRPAGNFTAEAARFGFTNTGSRIEPTRSNPLFDNIGFNPKPNENPPLPDFGTPDFRLPNTELVQGAGGHVRAIPPRFSQGRGLSPVGREPVSHPFQGDPEIPTQQRLPRQTEADFPVKQELPPPQKAPVPEAHQPETIQQPKPFTVDDIRVREIDPSEMTIQEIKDHNFPRIAELREKIRQLESLDQSDPRVKEKLDKAKTYLIHNLEAWDAQMSGRNGMIREMYKTGRINELRPEVRAEWEAMGKNAQDASTRLGYWWKIGKDLMNDESGEFRIPGLFGKKQPDKTPAIDLRVSNDSPMRDEFGFRPWDSQTVRVNQNPASYFPGRPKGDNPIPLDQKMEWRVKEGSPEYEYPAENHMDNLAWYHENPTGTQRDSMARYQKNLMQPNRTVPPNVFRATKQDFRNPGVPDPSENRKGIMRQLWEDESGALKAPTKPKDYYPLEYSSVGKSAEEILNNLVKTVAEREGYAPKGVHSFEMVRRDAMDVGGNVIANLLDRKSIEKLPAEVFDPKIRLAMRDEVDGAGTRLAEIAETLQSSRNTMTPEQVHALEMERAELEHKSYQLLRLLIPARTADGRNLVYNRIMARQTLSADYWIGRAQRAAGGHLPPDIAKEMMQVLAEARAAQARNDLEGMATAKGKLAALMTKSQKTSPYESFWLLRKAGLLLGVKTVARNVGGTGLFQVLEEVKRVPAWVADLGMSLVTKERTIQPPSLSAIRNSLYEIRTKGLKDAGNIWKTGTTLDDLEKWDVHREMNSGSPVLDWYVNHVFRFNAMQDRLFKAYAIRRAMEEMAWVAAKKASPGKSPEVVKALAQDFMKPSNPQYNTMMAEAINIGEWATFNNPNVISKMLSYGKRLHPAAMGAIETVVPFSTTPTNIAAMILRYAWGVGEVPGVSKAAYNAFKRQAFTPAEQKVIANAIGRGLTGSALIYAGYCMAQNGVLTGTYKRDPGQKGLNEAAGRSSGALKLGGNWHVIGNFAPVPNLLVLGASLYRDGSNLTNAAINIVKTATDQPFTQGLRQVSDIIQDPGGRIPKVFGEVAGSVLPTWLADMASVGDDKIRDAQGIREGMMKRIPGLRNQLPPKVNVLGEETPSSKWNAVNPFLSRKALEDDDPAIRDLVQRQQPMANPDKTWELTVEGEDGKPQHLKFQIGRKTMNYYKQLSGQFFKDQFDQWVQADNYDDMDDQTKQDQVRLLMTKAREGARGYILRELGQDHTLEEALDELQK